MGDELARTLIILFFAAAVLLPTQGSGQESRPPASLLEILREAQRGRWHVRALLMESDTITGEVSRLADARLTISATEVALHAVSRLERRRAARGLQQGALIGGAAGLAAGLLVFTPFAEAFGKADVFYVMGSWSLIGAAIGGTIGGIVTIGIHRWEPVWP